MTHEEEDSTPDQRIMNKMKWDREEKQNNLIKKLQLKKRLSTQQNQKFKEWFANSRSCIHPLVHLSVYPNDWAGSVMLKSSAAR